MNTHIYMHVHALYVHGHVIKHGKRYYRLYCIHRKSQIFHVKNISGDKFFCVLDKPPHAALVS